MDIADEAGKLEELNLNLALSNLSRKPDLLFTGSCYYCDALISEGSFCPAEPGDALSCRADYEKQESL